MAMRFGVLGAGRIGQVHASAIASVSGAELAAVADPAASAANAISDKYGCKVCTIDEIEAATDIDAVIICTPTNTHSDLIERFCRAGKAVFCEKPIDLSIQRVNDCLKVVNETKGRLMVGFNRRFDPDFNALKAAVDRGRIGAVEMVAITSRDPGPPPYEYIKTSGGILRDMTIHDFDVARWFLGEEVTSVMAVGSVLVDPNLAKLDDFDSVSIILKTASGKQCTISNSRRASYGYDQRIEVHGSDGAAQARNTHEANIEIAGTAGFHRPPLLNFFMTRYKAAYAAEIEAFIDAVENDTPMPTTGHDGLMALVLAEAALLSINEGRAVSTSEIMGGKG